MCAVAGSSRRIFERFDAADAGKIDVHEDHVRLVGARQLDAQISVPGAQQANIGPARDQLLDQLQIGRVVLHIEQRAQRRAMLDRRLGDRGGSAVSASSVGSAVEFSSNQNTLPAPTVLSTPITPPISSTSRLLITRPMPVPSSALRSCPRRLNG